MKEKFTMNKIIIKSDFCRTCDTLFAKNFNMKLILIISYLYVTELNSMW